METEKILTVDNNSIKLIKGQRGAYGWEIKVSDIEDESMIKRIKKIDNELNISFSNLTKSEEVNQNGKS